MLEVDTTIPYGNACDVAVRRTRAGWRVEFAADPHGGPESLWFCFRLRPGAGPLARGPVELVLQHVGNMLGGGTGAGLRPVIRYDGRDWQRLPAGRCQESSDGRATAAWTVRAPRHFADVAVCYPYGPPEIDSLLGNLGRGWRGDAIGVSQSARPIVRLSNSTGCLAPVPTTTARRRDPRRPGLYLIARQHSGETPGSWVLDGLLRRMATLGDKAPLTWAVPLSNIDGVVQGDYGKDNFPHDLNRAWGQPPMRHETLVIQRDLQAWVRRCRPALAIDFHAPGACEGDGAYFFLPKPELHAAHHRAASRWANLFGQALTRRYAARPIGRVARYPSRWESPTFATYGWSVLGLCALSMETPYATAGKTLLTRQAYRDMGQRMAEAIVRELQP